MSGASNTNGPRRFSNAFPDRGWRESAATTSSTQAPMGPPSRRASGGLSNATVEGTQESQGPRLRALGHDNWRGGVGPAQAARRASQVSSSEKRRGTASSVGNGPGPITTAPIQQTVLTEPLVVTFGRERQDPSFNPDRPAFLHGHPTFAQDPERYCKETLPFVATLTFRIESLPDANHMRQIIDSPALPQIFNAIMKIEFPEFHWFSGISHNRKLNPTLQLAAMLPNLQEITLHFHTAGLTTSYWGERERIRIENQGLLQRSQQLKIHRLDHVVRYYDLNRLFHSKKIEKIFLVCYDCPRVRFHTVNGDPLSAFRDLNHYFICGFYDQLGSVVRVTSRVDTDTQNSVSA